VARQRTRRCARELGFATAGAAGRLARVRRIYGGKRSSFVETPPTDAVTAPGGFGPPANSAASSCQCDPPIRLSISSIGSSLPVPRGCAPVLRNDAPVTPSTRLSVCSRQVCRKVVAASFRHPPPGTPDRNPPHDGEILKGVPTILMVGRYRIYFYSHEPNEPPHVHVDRDDQSAKFWLNPVALARNLGFGPVELRRVHRLVAENRTFLLEKWNERFPS